MAYMDFLALVRIFQNAQEIKTKIDEAINTKLNFIFNALKEHLKKIAIYDLEDVGDRTGKIVVTRLAQLTVQQ